MADRSPPPTRRETATERRMREALIPADRQEAVTGFAQERATTLGLAWDELSDAHREGIKQTIWTELNWRD